jgi:TPR repeat protein
MAADIGEVRQGRTTAGHGNAAARAARAFRRRRRARANGVLAALAMMISVTAVPPSWPAAAQTPGDAVDPAAFADALADFRRGEYATAGRKLLPLAEAGDAAAQYNLGFLLAHGLGRPADPVEAYVWFSLVALQGQPRGQVARDALVRRLTPAELTEAERRLRARRAAAR